MVTFCNHFNQNWHLHLNLTFIFIIINNNVYVVFKFSVKLNKKKMLLWQLAEIKCNILF